MAVVDYCFVPYKALPYYDDFMVYRAGQLFNEAGSLTYIDPSHTLPDHSLLTWNFRCMGDLNVSADPETVTDDPPVSLTK